MFTKLIAIACLLAIIPTPIAGQVNNWTQWTVYTACSATCGFTGTQFRTRVCIGGLGCPGLNRMEQPCNRFQCANGEWSQWTPYIACSRTCGFDGTQYRTRVCVGGFNCIGLPREELPCNRQSCDIGQWANWTPYTACSRTCGFDGTRFRTRACLGAINCIGLPREEQICNRQTCDIGQWANWTPFTVCSRTCGFDGTRYRTRVCLGAASCIGIPREEQICNRQTCDIGQWAQWTPHTACSHTCGFDGTQYRTRVCIGGSNCPGVPREELPCNRELCSIATSTDQWSTWSPWTACTATCGTAGWSMRTRTCLGRFNCPGLGHDLQPCNRVSCPSG